VSPMRARPLYDFSITQAVRTQLIEDGHSALVIETVSAAVHALELQVHTLTRDIKLLQEAEETRVNESGVHRIVKAEINREGADWFKWGLRAFLVMGGGLMAKLMWKGFRS
jgi:hypothetical protein